MAGYGASLAMLDKPATLAAFYGFLVRLLAVALIAGYVILTEMRTLERDNISLWLGLPVSRLRYLSEKICAYALLTLLMALLATAPLLWLGIDAAVLTQWSASFYCELLVVVSVALLLAVMFRQPLTALVAFAAIYLFARASAEFYRHSSNLIADPAGGFEYVLAWIVKLTTYLVPKLEQFAAAGWLLHRETADPSWESLLLQTLVFSSLSLVIALERLQRRTF